MEKLIPIKEAFFLRLVCTNGMITETRFSNRIRHIKENVLAGFANKVLKAA